MSGARGAPLVVILVVGRLSLEGVDTLSVDDMKHANVVDGQRVGILLLMQPECLELRVGHRGSKLLGSFEVPDFTRHEKTSSGVVWLL